MGLSLEYHCECETVLVPGKDGTKEIYVCPECNKVYERRRSDRKWIMRPITLKKKEGSGVTAPRPHFYGLLWD